MTPYYSGKWVTIDREHKEYPHHNFRVHAIVNSKDGIFGYVIEELENKQEWFVVYEGDANFAMSVGNVYKTLTEAKRQLKIRFKRCCQEVMELKI